MFVRVKNRPSQKVQDALLLNKYLPKCRVTSLSEYNGVVLDVDDDDAEDLVEGLEDLGFDAYTDE